MHHYKNQIQDFLLNQLRKYRKEEGTSQEKVAESLVISSRAYVNLENGKNGMSASTLMLFLSELPDESVTSILHDFRSYINDVKQQEQLPSLSKQKK